MKKTSTLLAFVALLSSTSVMAMRSPKPPEDILKFILEQKVCDELYGIQTSDMMSFGRLNQTLLSAYMWQGTPGTVVVYDEKNQYIASTGCEDTGYELRPDLHGKVAAISVLVNNYGTLMTRIYYFLTPGGFADSYTERRALACALRHIPGLHVVRNVELPPPPAENYKYTYHRNKKSRKGEQS